MKKVLAYIILIILALMITVGIIYKIINEGWLSFALTLVIGVSFFVALVWAVKTIDP
jgi:hypothetical protein